ncbi:MAG TPA: hypothetical protein V6D17_20900 [Candidatus Obscuribacterales bacterium]
MHCSSELPASKRSNVSRSFKSYALGALAAFVACLCCSLPLLPLMLGFSGALALKDRLGAYHQAFEAGAIAILLAGSVFIWQRHRKSGLKSLVLHIAAMLVMYGLMSVVMNRYLVPAVLGPTTHGERHSAGGNL